MSEVKKKKKKKSSTYEPLEPTKKEVKASSKKTKKLISQKLKKVSVKKGDVYGDFKVLRRLETETGYEYGCKCIQCGARKILATSVLVSREPPQCSSQICGEAKDLQRDKAEFYKDTRKEVNDIVKNITEEAKKSAKQRKSQTSESEDEEFYSVKIAEFKGQLENIKNELTEAGGRLSAQEKFQVDNVSMLIDILPIAYSCYEKDPKLSNMQSLSTLVTQIRELLADLMHDTSHADTLDSVISLVNPFWTDICQGILDVYMNIQNKHLVKMLTPDEFEIVQDNLKTELQNFSRQSNTRANKLLKDIKELE